MSRDTPCTLRVTSFTDFGLTIGCLYTQQPTENCSSAWNAQEDVFLLFRGEIFPVNDSACRVGTGERPNSIADTLLSQYEEFGSDVFAELNGCFSGVLVDLRNKTIVWLNDRYGLGRMYYHESSDGFYFASEAKALLKVLPSLRQLDVRSLGEFLSCDCVLQDRTMFRDVFILPAGSAWVFRPNGVVEKHRYFHPSAWENQVRLSAQDYYELLRETFPRVLTRYLRHPAGVGMSLTGGLDGRLVMAWSQLEPGAMPCYTFGSSFRETADVGIAREVASVCRQPYSELKVDGDFLSQFPKLAQEAIRISDGAMDVSGAAELYLNRLAEQIKPVRLTGNYGSEILRGNVAFRPRPIFNAVFDAEVADAAEQARATYAEESRGNRRSFIAFKQVPWHHFARSVLEKSQLIVRSPYLDNELVALAFQAPDADHTNFDLCVRLVAEGNSRLARIPTDRGVRYGASTALNRFRRMKGQFLAKTEYAYDYGMPNWLARVDSAVSGLRLERVFLGRQKFCHFRTWYRQELAGFVREVLLDRRTLARPLLNRRRVEKVVSSHIKGCANQTLLIHKLLSFELLHQTLIEQN
jgi:asparagine synthase (glutamine-hydrolysing)